MTIDIIPEATPITERSVNIFAHIARYTRFVMFTKVGLMSLLAIFLAYVIYEANSDNNVARYSTFHNESQAPDNQEAEPTRMIKPKYQGIDAKGQSYNISGDYALQVKKELVRISKLQGDITLKDGSWLSVSSDVGDVMLDTKQVLLEDNSVIFHDSGYEFHGTNILFDINNKTAHSNRSISGNGMFGNVHADSFFLDATKSSVRFIGNVKLIVYTNAK